MEVLNSVKDYRKYLPEYKDWRDKQELQQAQKLEYIKQNPDKYDKDDIQRGKILLHAIDVMDEYSQTYAEDMEVATEFAKSQIVAISTMLGMGAGTLLALTKPVQKAIQKVAGNGRGAMMIAQMLPSVVGMMVGFAASFPAITWATKAKISASRKGRFEAMRKDLNNPAIFAVLTAEQAQKAKETAKDVQLDEKTQKRLNKKNSMGANPLESIATLKKYFSEDKEYQIHKKEFDTMLKESEKNLDGNYSEDQIRKAKHDQQVLAHMVRKMDLASQDYAENTELATNTLISLSLAGGGLVGWASNKLLKLLKVGTGSVAAKVIPWGVGLAIPLLMSMYAAKLQKHASRIGRYKAKQEMLNNPESLIYVDKNETDKMTGVKVPEDKKRPNMFKFFVQMIKDNKEYEHYRKTELTEDLKRHKAIEKLELSPEQLDEAKVLQTNVFRTFNKVDEKSQNYSESVEAVGEMTKQGVSVFGSLVASGISTWSIMKMLENPKYNALDKSISGAFKRAFIPLAFVLLPVILIDVYTTKAQKKASRVADMLALKELEDYRLYAGYNDNSAQKAEIVQSTGTDSSNLLKTIKAS